MKKNANQSKNNPGPVLETLEPRVLFSGDILGLSAVLPDSHYDEFSTDNNQLKFISVLIDQNVPADEQEESGQKEGFDDLHANSKANKSLELIFVDRSVSNYQQLLDDLVGNTGDREFDIVYLDARDSGISVISETLKSYVDLDGIHLISHGADGQLNLGSDVLDNQSLLTNQDRISVWADAISDDGDILIYGCNVAETQSGESFVQRFAELTKSDVAASNDLTGSKNLAGDWQLEFKVGDVETAVAFNHKAQLNFTGVMQAVEVSNTSDIENGNVSSITALIADDGGDGISLREAITAANNTGGADSISFNIIGPLVNGAHTISLTAALPQITDTVILDATTNPAFSGTPIIELDGSGVAAGPTAKGFNLKAPDSTIKGFVINNFDSDGIGIYDDNNTIQGNYIGTDASGNTAAANGRYGINFVGASNNTIGGLDAAERNIISGNQNAGIRIQVDSDSNRVQGNYIGVGADGITAVGNQDEGIVVGDASDNNLIGGVSVGSENIIANNVSAGVTKGSDADGVGNSILGNRIYDNGQLGISWGGNTPTLNDTGDVDVGPNNLQNFPVITTASYDGSSVSVLGSLQSAPNTTYRIELFVSSNAEPSGYGEGHRVIQSLTVTSNNIGGATFLASATTTVNDGDYITATATVDLGGGNFGDTSEFSQQILISGFNQDPVNNGSLPAAVAVNQGVVNYLAIASIDIVDVDAGVSAVDVILATSTGGKLIASSGSGVGVSGSNTNTLTLTGNITDINSYLDGTSRIGYLHPDLSVIGPSVDTLTISANDNGNNGLGGGINVLLGSVNINIADINLTPSYSIGDGTATTPITTEADLISDGQVQADGKIVSVGYVNDIAGWDFIITRHNTDGSLDTSFSGDGKLRLDVVNGRDRAAGVVIQADGKILITGTTSNSTDNFTLVRLNSDGSLDSSFGGGDGIAILDLSASDYISTALTLQADGKILVLGHDGSNTAIARFNSDGSIDSSFDLDGLLTVPFGSGAEIVSAITTDASGRIVMTAYGQPNGNGYDAIVARFLADGSFDTSFGSGLGYVELDLNSASNEGAYDVKIQTDGKIVVSGTTTANGGSYEPYVLRLNDDGSLDTSFGAGTGYSVIPVSVGTDTARSVDILPDGKIVTAGWTGTNYLVARFNADGSVDSSFGTSGYVTSTLPFEQKLEAVIAQADGSIVAIGHQAYSTTADGFIIKLNSDGSVDTNFAKTSTLNGVASFTEGGAAVLLDDSVDLSDPELDALNSGNGDYTGGNIVLKRSVGANAEDHFGFASANGVSLVSGELFKNGNVIGSFDTTTVIGQLEIIFTNANGEIPTSADVDNILSQITYRNTSENPDSFIIVDWNFGDGNDGSQGSGGERFVIDSSRVNITPVNDSPGITAPVTFNVAEEVLTTLSGISISDVDAGSANVEVGLRVTWGDLNVTLAGGATITAGSNASAQLTIVGSTSDVNATLLSLSYTGNTDIYGSGVESLSIIANDMGNTGGPAETSSSVMTIDINPVNDAPVNVGSLPSSLSVPANVNSNVNFSSINLTDVDVLTQTLTIIFETSTGGNLTVSSPTPPTVNVTGSGTSQVSINGTLSELNNFLDDTSNIEYLHGTAGVFGNNADSIEVRVDDQGNIGTGGVLLTLGSVNINITDNNLAPINTLPATFSGNEDALINLAGISIADIDAATGVVETQLTVASGVLNITLSGAATISFGATGSATFTVQGTLTDINASLASLSYQGNSNFNGVDNLNMVTSDLGNAGGNAQTDTDSAVINVGAVNNAPVNTLHAVFSGNEDAVINLAGVSIADIDAATGVVQTQLTVASGVLNITLSGTATISSGTTGSATFTAQGNLTDINASLASLSYQGNSNFNGVDNLNMVTSDLGNTGGASQTDTDSAVINVGAVNSAPVNTLPAAFSGNEDAVINLAGVNIADIDAATGVVQTQLTVASGVLNITLSGAATISSGTNGSTTFTLQGTLADINASLASLSYQGNSNFNGVDSLNMITSDLGNTGGAAQTDTDSAVINVAAVNSAPVNTLPAVFSGNEDAVINLSGISIADIDAASGVIQTQLTVASGILNITLSGAATISSGATGSATFIVQGNLTDINASLATLSYQGDSNFNGVDNLNMVTSDLGNTGGAAQTDTDSSVINVGAANSAPVNTLPATFSGNEDSVINLAGVSIADIDAATGVVQTQITVANGVLNITLSGTATINSGAAGSSTFTVQGILADINASLATLSYQGNSNFNGVDNLNMMTSDLGNTGGAAQTDTDNAQITVVPVEIVPINTAPVSNDNSIEAIEDSAYTFEVSDFPYVDADLDSIVSVTIVTVPEFGKLLLNDITVVGGQGINIEDIRAGNLSYLANENGNGDNFDRFTFTTSDGNLDSSLANININVSAINDDPINIGNSGFDVETVALTLTSLDLSEIEIVDIDSENGLISLKLTSGENSEIFIAARNGIVVENNGSNEITVIGDAKNINLLLQDIQGISYNYIELLASDTRDTITISLSDLGNVGQGGGGYIEVASVNVTIAASHNNAAPVNSVGIDISLKTNSVIEIPDISVTDIDGDLQTVTVSVNGGHLSLDLSGNASIISGQIGTASITLSGNQHDINNSLASLTYTSPNTPGVNYQLRVISEDSASARDDDYLTITVETLDPQTPNLSDPNNRTDDTFSDDLNPKSTPTVDSTPGGLDPVSPNSENISPFVPSIRTSGPDRVVGIFPEPMAPEVIEDLIVTRKDVNDQIKTQQTKMAFSEYHLSPSALLNTDVRRLSVLDHDSSRNLDPVFTKDYAEMKLMQRQDDEIFSQTIVGLSLSTTAGILAWILRAGSLVAALASIKPMWGQFDPLPILGNKGKSKADSKSKNNDNDSSSSEVNAEEDIFTSKSE